MEEELPDTHLFAVHIMDDHFADVIQVLMTRIALEGYSTQQKKDLVVHATYSSVIVGQLYNMGMIEVLRRYVPKFERVSILAEAHEGVVGGHYAKKATM